jgi:hypothetical protein
MRSRWTFGLIIGLGLLYLGYFGASGVRLTLYPNRTTNLKAGMSWSTLEGSYTYTYNVTSVVGSLVYVHQREVTGTVDNQLVIDVTDTRQALVVASGLDLGDELVEMNGSMINYPSSVYIYVNSTESVSGKTLLVGVFNYDYQGMPFGYTFKYYQDSGVLYSLAVMMNGVTQIVIQCTSGDPVKTTYTITASAGIGGSISPSGAVIVNIGASQSFTITSDSGYEISSVLVDGASIDIVSSYTFTNVQVPHLISASFSLSEGTQVHLYAIYNGNSVTATLQIHFPDGHDESNSTPYNNFDALVGIYTVSAVYQDKVISSYVFILTSGTNFAHTFDFGTGSTPNGNYILLILRSLLNNSDVRLLMMGVGALTTLISGIMFLMPKKKVFFS